MTDTTTQEIEITPQMIEAAAGVLCAVLDVLPSLAQQVAMEMLEAALFHTGPSQEHRA